MRQFAADLFQYYAYTTVSVYDSVDCMSIPPVLLSPCFAYKDSKQIWLLVSVRHCCREWMTVLHWCRKYDNDWFIDFSTNYFKGNKTFTL